MGGWAIDAYQAQQNANAQQTNAIANAADVINKERAEKRNALLKQLEFYSLIGDHEQRNKIQNQLDKGEGILGDIGSLFRRDKKMQGVKSSLDTGGQNGGEGGVGDITQAQLNAVNPDMKTSDTQHDILNQLKAEYKNDPDGLKKMIGLMNNQAAGNLQPSGGVIDKSSGRFTYNENGNLYDTITGVEYDKSGKQIVTKKTDNGFTVPVDPSELKDGISQEDYKNAGKIAKQNIAPAKDVINANEKEYAQDQKKYDKMVKIQEAQEKRNFSKDPDTAIKKMLKQEGFGDTYEGSFSDMTSQATKKFQRAIDIAVAHKDYNLAEKLNKQYKVDMYAIHKNWLDKPQMKDIDDLFIRPKGGDKGKMVWFDFQTIGKNGVSDPQPHRLLVSEAEASDPDLLWKRISKLPLYSGSIGIKPTKGRGMDNELYSLGEEIKVAYNNFQNAKTPEDKAMYAKRIKELKLAQSLKENQHWENVADLNQ